jgi:hypothetical protein
MGFRQRYVRVFGYIAIGLGIAIFVETAALGGGTLGYVLGVLFVCLGVGRLYLLRRR